VRGIRRPRMRASARRFLRKARAGLRQSPRRPRRSDLIRSVGLRAATASPRQATWPMFVRSHPARTTADLASWARSDSTTKSTVRSPMSPESSVNACGETSGLVRRVLRLPHHSRVTRAGGTDWAPAVEAHSRALLSEGRGRRATFRRSDRPAQPQSRPRRPRPRPSAVRRMAASRAPARRRARPPTRRPRDGHRDRCGGLRRAGREPAVRDWRACP